ncbi:uncharacterized protein LOC106091502 [Stomoxys calcitrans]|uniref:uncharacterized protein LOC106091502 n=1 Tax=Stomoxys calcitrans TaxID=35570 RepID=UPI0027E2482B|nr:uncharacterized protein LOC106091502 [Stomoxys calcitrans]
MANENDQQHHQTASQNTKDCEKSVVDSIKGNDDGSNENKESSKDEAYYAEEERESLDIMPTSSKGKLNDLVADLCINGHRSHAQAGYGDYQLNRSSVSGSVNESAGADAGGSNNNTAHNVQAPPPTQNSSFSFKHFLSSSSVPTAPSTTVTSLDPPLNVSSTSATSSNSSSAMSTRSLQTSTGARPKVPQSNSVSSTLTVSGTSSNSGGEGLSVAATKMKRSPRFSSFDSQASLAEYAGAPTTADLPPGEASSIGGVSKSSDYRLYPDERERDRFAEWNLPSNAPTMTTNSSDYDRGQYVPRSYSNYEIPRPQTSPRRRVGIGANRDARPTRLTLNTNPTMAAKLKLDLPINQNSVGGSANLASSSNRRSALSTRPTDFQQSNSLPAGAAAAAALPDFVQDHWMDSWYANDMHVNSPPSSPIYGLAEDVTEDGSGDQAAGGCGGGGGGGGARPRNRDNVPLPGPADLGSFNMGLPEPSSSSVGSKMLPDFLSDGPIIHSSQRLADIAAGLPSNSVGSPEDSNMTTQLSRLRSDNELLQRELNETRAALNEQTLRANNLERQLLEQQRQHKSQTEETLDSNKKHSTAVQNLVSKLKQQVQQLTSEVEILRREKDLMREEGAVGGFNVTNCDRSPSSYAAAATSVTSNKRSCADAATAAAAATTGAVGSVNGSEVMGGGCMGVSSSTSGGGQAGGIAGRGVIGLRPSRAQQISLDLRRAASNAEQNLRQLLAGVDNLRQMAADIEKPETHLDYDASPDLFSDFIDDCDDYEEYPGGPAL